MKRTLASIAVAASLAVSSNVQAQGIPVIDVSSLAQMVLTVEQLKSQLTQMRTLYNSTVGSRGLSGLINNPLLRSYLPSDVNSVLSMVGTGASGDLAGLSRQILANNAVLTPDQISLLHGTNKSVLSKQRDEAASQSAAAQAAFKAASERFSSLQVLIDSIDGQTDPKAIQDLQARIQAEQVMMQNENAKLQALASASVAQKQLNEQRAREEAIRFIDTKPPRF